MYVETADPSLRAVIRRLPARRLRLTLDYPADEPVAGQVRAALAELVRSGLAQAPHPAAEDSTGE
jgi:hypothetical protein